MDLFGCVRTCFVSRPFPGVFRSSCNGILEVYEKLVILKQQALEDQEAFGEAHDKEIVLWKLQGALAVEKALVCQGAHWKVR